MISCVLIITLAFIWLLYESNWMRVRLPIGNVPIIPITTPIFDIEKWFNELGICPGYKYGFTPDKPLAIKPFQEDLTPVKLYRYKLAQHYVLSRDDDANEIGCHHSYPGGLHFSAGVTEPLCGWDWLLEREHPQVSYQIFIEAWGCKHAIVFNPDAHKGKIIQQVCSAALKLTQAERQEIKRQNKILKAKYA